MRGIALSNATDHMPIFVPRDNNTNGVNKCDTQVKCTRRWCFKI